MHIEIIRIFKKPPWAEKLNRVEKLGYRKIMKRVCLLKKLCLQVL